MYFHIVQVGMSMLNWVKLSYVYWLLLLCVVNIRGINPVGYSVQSSTISDGGYKILYVKKKPRITRPPEHVGVIAGQKAIFVCLVQGNPFPSVKWLVQDSEFLESRFQVISRVPRGSVLHLTDATMQDDQRRVTCRVENILGSVDKTAVITVYSSELDVPRGYPRFSNSFSPKVRKKNQNVTLECLAHGSPQPNIRWFKDSSPIDLNSPRLTQMSSGALYIMRTNELDEGMYQCTATNVHGTRLSPNHELQIREDILLALNQLLNQTMKQFMPHFTHRPRNQEISPGGAVTLRCKAVGHPQPTIAFYKGSTQINHSSGNKTEVVLHLSDISESMVVTCRASNSLGDIEHQVKITVKEIPLPPKNFRAVNIKPTECSFEWLSMQSSIHAFIIFHAETKDKSSQQSKRVSAPASTASVQNLKAFTEYRAWIIAVSINGESAPSENITFNTTELPPSDSPRDIRVKAISNNELIARWNPPLNPNGIIIDYRIYYAYKTDIALSGWHTFNNNWFKENSNSQLPTYYCKITHMDYNKMAFVRISAVNSAGEGLVSNIYPAVVRAGVLPRPRNFNAHVRSPQEIFLFWSHPDSESVEQIKHYLLKYQIAKEKEISKYTEFTEPFSQQQLPRDNVKYLVTTLLPNTTYRFQLIAVSNAGNGVPAYLEAKTKKAGNSEEDVISNVEPPRIISLKPIGSDRIELCWQTADSFVVAFWLLVKRESKFTEINAKMRRQDSQRLVQCYVADNLQPQTFYSFQLRSERESGMGPYSTPMSVSTNKEVPGAPENAQMSTVNSSTLLVSWQAPTKQRERVQHYIIRYYKSDISGRAIYSEKMSMTVRGQDVNDTGWYNQYLTSLDHNSFYRVSVYPVSSKGRGDPAKLDPQKTKLKPPGPPRDLILQSKCPDPERPCVTLTWAAPEDVGTQENPVIGYRVRYEILHPLELRDHTSIEQRSRNVTSLFHTTYKGELKPGVTYTFYVAARNTGDIGKEISRTLTLEPTKPSDSPKMFKVLNNQPTSFLTMWEPPPVNFQNGNITEYRVRCTNLQQNDLEAGGKTKVTTLVVENLQPDTRYVCMVQAFNEAGGGTWSNPITMLTGSTPHVQPKQIRVIRISKDKLKVTWQKPSYKIKGYTLYYSTHDDPNNKNAWNKIKLDSTRTLIVINRLQSNSMYVVRMSTIDPFGVEGPWSAPVTSKKMNTPQAPVGAVRKLACPQQDSKGVYLTWQKPSVKEGILHYRINYTGIQRFIDEKGNELNYSLPEKEKTKSFTSGKQVDFRVTPLLPNTLYTFSVEPVYKADVVVLSYMREVTCQTNPEIPSYVPPPAIISVDRQTSTVTLKLKRASEQNGVITRYHLIVSPVSPPVSNRADTHSTNSDDQLFKDANGMLTPDSLTFKDLAANGKKASNEAPYLASSIPTERLFRPKSAHTVYVLGKSKAAFTNEIGMNKVLIDNVDYRVALRACVQISSYEEKCNTSSWSPVVNTAHRTVPFDSTSNYRKPRIATAIIAVVVGLALLAVLCISMGCILRRRRSKPALSNAYIHANGNHMSTLTSSTAMNGDPMSKQPLLVNTTIVPPTYSVSPSLQDPVEMCRINCQTPGMVSHPPVPITRLHEHIAALRSNDGHFFSSEYESIDPGQQFTWQHSNLEVNKPKNRYANVIAYDHSRVVLQSIDALVGSDYINANYIDGYRKQNAYIATQGPLPETITDFWRMVWEQRSSTIVMMTRLEERNRIKCDQYWPTRNSGTYGMMTVIHLDTADLAYYTIRTFALQKAGSSEKREIRQFQFTSWPDHGVPQYPTPLLIFLRRVRASNPPDAGPVVVHCSAGVGRTGAFIVIDSMLERIKHEKTIDVYGHVTCLRAQRNYMVQTEEQYIFIHDVLLDAVTYGNTEVPARNLLAHVQKLSQREPSGSGEPGATGFDHEFRMLSQGKIDPGYFESANLPVNQRKNRLVNILPFEENRVRLRPIRGVEGSDYINSSYIDGYKSTHYYIASQGPLPETVEDFWRMLWEQNSNIVVLLTKLRELTREKCHQYWPNERSARYQYFVVDPMAEYNMPNFILREFKVTDARDGQSRTIRQFHFTEWPEQGIPASGDAFIDFIGQVHKTKDQFGQDGPITVHCSAGVGRTGVFISLSIVLEKMRYEGVVDLFQTVKMLRTQRPCMVQTEDQYRFCYNAALEYLSSFDHYST